MKDMNTDTIPETVTRILAEQALLDPADVARDATLEGIGLDSLGLVECIFAIEETFDIAVPFNANDPEAGGLDLTTVDSVIEAVRGLLKAQAG